jgi:hypothetical protein
MNCKVLLLASIFNENISSMEIISNIIGLIGVAAVLFAYLALQLNWWRAKDFIYSFVNLLGSLLILYSLYFHWNLASVTIEVIWFLISSYGIWKSAFVKKPSENQ